MEGASAGKRVILKIVRHPYMTHLRVHEPMDEPAVYDQASSNACPDRQINKIIDTLCRSPTRFG